MKNKGLGRIVVVLCLLVVLATPTLTAACAKPAATPTSAPPPSPVAQPIRLKAVTFLGPQVATVKVAFLVWRDMVNQAAKGELVIDYVGGPEIIPGESQPEAVRTGSVQMGMFPVSYYPAILPEAGVFPLSRLSLSEERKSGFHDFMVELHKKAGFYYLGRGKGDDPFLLYSKVTINRPEDMAGKKWQSEPFFAPIAKELGGTPVTIAFGDVYSAIQSGVVDGGMAGHSNMVQGRWYEQFKFIPGPPFSGKSTAVHLLNLDAWNRIPKRLQDLMIDAQLKLEPLMTKSFEELLVQNMKTMLDYGVKRLEWSDADNKKFAETVERVRWKTVQDKTGPEYVEKVKKLMGY